MNSLIKDKVTIIIPNNPKSKTINIVINNFKSTYPNSDIIVISQENNEPFMKGQLYNIAFKYVKTEYILLIDDNIYNLQKLNLIETYKKINHSYLGFGNISEISLDARNNVKVINTENICIYYGAFAFMKYADFSNCNGFSNLCFNLGYEDEILNCKLNNFKRLNNTIGFIGNFKSIVLDKLQDNNKKILNLYKDKEIEFYEDGYRQTLYDSVYDYTKKGIRYIGVDYIHVSNNFKYLDLYNEQLNYAKNNLKNIHKKDIGVSICITAYKAKETIKETLDSVIRQTWFQKYDNWEILLGIDNCEETLEYIKTIMNNYKNLRVFMMDSNKGTYVTTNTLMKIAKYENLIRFDSDDVMCSNLVETLMNNADQYDLQLFRFAYSRNKWKTTRTSLGQHFIKKSVFEIFGGYRDWKCAADYDFVTRIYKFVRFKKLNDKYLFYYSTNDNSLTHANDTGMKSEYRKKLHEFVDLQNYDTLENSKIECITNTYKEVFSNIFNYDQSSYMYKMILENNWPDLS